MQFVWRLSETGGIQRVVRDLLQGIDLDRFEVDLCSVRPIWPEDHLELLDHTIKLHSLEVTGSLSRLGQVWASIRAARLVRRINPDVIHVHSGTAWYMFPAIVRSGRRTRAVLDVHDSPQSGRVSRINSLIEAWMIRRRRLEAVVHSTSVAAELASSSGVPLDRIHLIPIGIDSSRYDRPESGKAWRCEHGIDESRVLVTSVARLVPTKNVGMFLRGAEIVAREYPETTFVVVGDGPERQSLESSVDRPDLAGRVIFTGAEADLVPVLNASDLFVSTSDYEGFGIAILEAMAARTAVVATSVGGTTDLVVPGVTGRLVPRGDLDSLVEAVRDLLAGLPSRGDMAAAGQARAREQFHVERMVDEYQDLYRPAVRGPR